MTSTRLVPSRIRCDGVELEIDVDLIDTALAALTDPYDIERWTIPLPVWALRAYDHDGSTAWRELRADATTANPDRPLCVYLHVPFCASKCHFCDCYSFRLPHHRVDDLAGYAHQLCTEIATWNQEVGLGCRPVSTVHLGGGTPTFLGPGPLAELVACLRAHLRTSADTEWALESTSSELTPAMTDTLERLGFTRLHVGVQTLDDSVRRTIGRRSHAPDVLARIAGALDRGWTVSVDLVCGLPGQTVQSLLQDTGRLIRAGVNGVSLYELLIYPQNERWAARHHLTSRTHLPNYLMFQGAAQLLEHHGYRKNTFNHWADRRDDNRYFTFPSRGEDCLALGTIADGVLGNYHYRHGRYGAYRAATRSGMPGLEGGLRRTAEEDRLHTIGTSIMSGRMSRRVVDGIGCHPTAGEIIQRWLDAGLVRQTRGGGLELLTNGSWFTGNMLRELPTTRSPEPTR